jgi:hypothetical protein
MQFFSIFLYNKKHISLYANTYFLGEFDENPNHKENFKVLKFSKKRLQGNKRFFKAFG